MRNILIYQNENDNIKVDVLFEDESLCLSQTQICEVFGKAKSSTIVELKEGELDEGVQGFNDEVRLLVNIHQEEQ